MSNGHYDHCTLCGSYMKYVTKSGQCKACRSVPCSRCGETFETREVMHPGGKYACADCRSVMRKKQGRVDARV